MENMTLKLINNNQSESSSDSLISSKTSNKSQSQIINNLIKKNFQLKEKKN